MRSIYEELPEDCLYIAVVDRDFNLNFYFKRRISEKKSGKYSLYLCGFFTSQLNPLFKSNCYLLSLFILFKKFQLKYDKLQITFEQIFSLSKIKKEIQNLQFQSIDESTSNYLKQSRKVRGFLCSDEEIYAYSFFRKKMGVTHLYLFPIKIIQIVHIAIGLTKNLQCT